jgi:hypothetical protein
LPLLVERGPQGGAQRSLRRPPDTGLVIAAFAAAPTLISSLNGGLVCHAMSAIGEVRLAVGLSEDSEDCQSRNPMSRFSHCQLDLISILLGGITTVQTG